MESLRPPDFEFDSTDGLEVFSASHEAAPLTLSDLPIGARLIIRCRTDWRYATLVELRETEAVLRVASPTGRTYKLRRPIETELTVEGSIPKLGAGHWQAAIARYDERW